MFDTTQPISDEDGSLLRYYLVSPLMNGCVAPLVLLHKMPADKQWSR